MDLREKLIELRKEQNYTQAQLAEKLEISKSAIKNYESKTTNRAPEVPVLQKYCSFFNVSFDYLINPSNNNKTNENIVIENILNLSDKAISNLKNTSHLPINLFIESNQFSIVNNLLDIYIKVSNILHKLKILFTDTIFNDIVQLSIELDKAISLYNSYTYENHNLQFYSFDLDDIDTCHSFVIDDLKTGEKIEDDVSLENVQEELFTLYRIFINAQKTCKLELLENLSEFLKNLEQI